MSTHERWLPAVGYEGRYEVSSLGRVFSIDNGHPSTGRVLRASPNPRGYPRVCLTAADGTRRAVLVHILVCTAFHGPNPGGMEVLHRDGTRRNHDDNLRWGTRAENIADGKQHGVYRSPTNKLSDEQLREIVDSDMSVDEIGARYAVSKSYAVKLRGRHTVRIRRVCAARQDLSRVPACRRLAR